MTANPWDKFFWNDWENDPALKLCGLSAQGLWMRILCICAKADPKGYLVVAGRPLSASDLAALAGKPQPEVETLLRELVSYGVSSTDRTGRIYSRRMVRDAKKSRDNVENGKKGGNPRLSKQKENYRSVNPPDNPEDKPHKPEAISQKPAVVDATAADEMNRLTKLLGFDERDFVKHAENIRILIDLKAQGCDFAAHIWPAAEQAARSKRARSLNYIRPKAIEMRDAAKIVSAMPTPFENADERGWCDRVRVFREKAMWSPKWGPKPDEPGCKCPGEILAQQEAA